MPFDLSEIMGLVSPVMVVMISGFLILTLIMSGMVIVRNYLAAGFINGSVSTIELVLLFVPYGYFLVVFAKHIVNRIIIIITLVMFAVGVVITILQLEGIMLLTAAILIMGSSLLTFIISVKAELLVLETFELSKILIVLYFLLPPVYIVYTSIKINERLGN